MGQGWWLSPIPFPGDCSLECRARPSYPSIQKGVGPSIFIQFAWSGCWQGLRLPSFGVWEHFLRSKRMWGWYPLTTPAMPWVTTASGRLRTHMMVIPLGVLTPYPKSDSGEGLRVPPLLTWDLHLKSSSSLFCYPWEGHEANSFWHLQGSPWQQGGFHEVSADMGLAGLLSFLWAHLRNISLYWPEPANLR